MIHLIDFRLSYTCPTAPPPPPMTSIKTTTPLPPPPSTDPLPSTTSGTTTNSVSKARTIIYTLPPTPGSRVSSASTGPASVWVILLWMVSSIWIWIHFRC
ncbi:hypothetical protein TNIN_84521 [Trichonephila inaurata madagascariensis]|uniref:Uncharacterized protein n=1 Tax=Trichonephila inaurata madagascariensis TaxID=2747483 RepID=A0A8X6Y9V9_9ARAC|nr:hypothetical protein TNIN_84521 [Trichonephila inaurata madagascariensis]